MIECRGVCKSFGDHRVLSELDLHVEAGELVVLVGSSGCGKSTLLRLFNALLSADSGALFFEGRALSEWSTVALRRKMGYVIQSTGLFPHWTVWRNVATVPRLLGWPAAKIEARVVEVMAQVELPAERFGPLYPHQLSGGQAQRVGVARALAGDPDVLLMDEPFAALDPITRRGLQQQLRRLQRASGKTVVFVTHDMEEALLLADRIAVMRAGKIVQMAAPAALLRHPQDDFVAGFLGGDLGLRLLERRSVAEALAQRPQPHQVQPFVCDAQGHPTAWAAGVVSAATTPLSPHALLRPEMSLREALSQMVWTGARVLPVVDASGVMLGLLTLTEILSGGRDV